MLLKHDSGYVSEKAVDAANRERAEREQRIAKVVRRTGEIAQPVTQPQGLLQRMAGRYGMDPVVFEKTISAVSMPAPHSRAELISCLIVAHEHDLNPLTKEIYFMRTKTGTIQPIVGVDGWMKKLNQHPEFNGMRFVEQRDDKGNLVAMTCVVYRKDRTHPIEVTEHLKECAGDTLPWKKSPSRMLRHRVLTQAARYSVGFAGGMDADEFEQWQASDVPVKSAAQAKRDGDYDAARQAIRACSSADDIEAFKASDLWLRLPERWKGLLEDDEINPLLEKLSKDAPIADPDGFVAMLSDKLSGAADDIERADIAESFADLIERLPDDQKSAAMKLMR